LPINENTTQQCDISPNIYWVKIVQNMVQANADEAKELISMAVISDDDHKAKTSEAESAMA
jgi:hypothetical protein